MSGDDVFASASVVPSAALPAVRSAVVCRSGVVGGARVEVVIALATTVSGTSMSAVCPDAAASGCTESVGSVAIESRVSAVGACAVACHCLECDVGVLACKL